MRFFANSSINYIYLHSALRGLSEQIGGIFVFLFLLKAGVAMHFVLLSYALLVLCRLVIRKSVVPFAMRYGLKTALIMGVLIGCIAYLPLGFVQGVSLVLLSYLALQAIGDSFYWSCYHAITARLGDEEARGAQVSAVQLIYALGGIVGPVVGGALHSQVGSLFAFCVASVIRLISVWPLVMTANVTMSSETRVAPQAKRFAQRIFFCDGIMTAGSSFTWSMVLFITLGQNFQNYGLALAMAAVIGAVMALGVGRLFDLGHHRWSVIIGMGSLALFTALAALGYRNPVVALVALGIAAVAGPLYASAFNARVYNLAKASGDPLRFHVSGEGGWDVGCALGCSTAALLIWAGFDYAWPIALGLIGIAGVTIVLRQSYQSDEPSFLVKT